MKVKSEVMSFSRVRLLATPWTAAYQAPPSTGFSRQEYWSGMPVPSPKNKLGLTKCTDRGDPGLTEASLWGGPPVTYHPQATKNKLLLLPPFGTNQGAKQLIRLFGFGKRCILYMDILLVPHYHSQTCLKEAHIGIEI